MAKEDAMQVKDGLLRARKKMDTDGKTYDYHQDEEVRGLEARIESLRVLRDMIRHPENNAAKGLSVVSSRRMIAGIELAIGDLSAQIAQRKEAMQTAFKMNMDAAHRLSYTEKAVIKTHTKTLAALKKQAEARKKSTTKGKDSGGMKVSKYVGAEAQMIKQFIIGRSTADAMRRDLGALVDRQRELDKVIAKNKGKVQSFTFRQ